jgi:hypothetical protein
MFLDIVSETCSFVQQEDGLAIKASILKDMKRLLLGYQFMTDFMSHYGETCLELAECLQDDGECLLSAYIALSLCGGRKPLLARVKRRLEPIAAQLDHVFVAENIANLMDASVIQEVSSRPNAIVKLWRAVIKEMAQMMPESWPHIEQDLIDQLLNRLRVSNIMSEAIDASPFAPFFFSDYERFCISNTVARLSSLEAIFPDHPKIGVLKGLYGIFKRKQSTRIRALENMLNKANPTEQSFILEELRQRMSYKKDGSNWMLLVHTLFKMLPNLHDHIESLEQVLSACDQALTLRPRGKGIVKMRKELEHLMRYKLEEMLDVRKDLDLSDRQRGLIQNALERL